MACEKPNVKMLKSTGFASRLRENSQVFFKSDWTSRYGKTWSILYPKFTFLAWLIRVQRTVAFTYKSNNCSADQEAGAGE